MLHNFGEACRHEERCSKDPLIVISGKRDGGRSGGRVITTSKLAVGAAIEVADIRNDDDDIVTTVSARQHAARVRAGARSKAQDKYGVRKFDLSSLPLLLLASTIFFHAPKR